MQSSFALRPCLPACLPARSACSLCLLANHRRPRPRPRRTEDVQVNSGNSRLRTTPDWIVVESNSEVPPCLVVGADGDGRRGVACAYDPKQQMWRLLPGVRLPAATLLLAEVVWETRKGADGSPEGEPMECVHVMDAAMICGDDIRRQPFPERHRRAVRGARLTLCSLLLAPCSSLLAPRSSLLAPCSLLLARCLPHALCSLPSPLAAIATSCGRRSDQPTVRALSRVPCTGADGRGVEMRRLRARGDEQAPDAAAADLCQPARRVGRH